MLPEHSSRRVHRTGQALSEYGLIMALVAVVSIATLASLGKAISGAIQAMMPTPTPVIASSTSPAASPASQMPPPLVIVPPPIVSNPPLSSGMSVTTAEGHLISLPAYPTNVKDAIMVSGANGATSVMADTLSSMAKQLLDAGEITASQYNDLVALSNQGHTLANLEKSLEDAAAQATSSADYAKMKVTFNGKSYSVKPLSDAQGYDTNSQDATKVKDPMDTDAAIGQTATFLKLYDKIQSGGAMSDPAVRAVVDSLVGQISYLSEVAVCNTYKAANGDMSPSDIRNGMVSDMTHVDSLGICQAGNGKDTGIQCSG